MTTILIDAGNSRLKWALLTAGERSPQQALAYGGHSPQAGALQHLQALLAHYPAVTRVVLVHVLGEAFAHEAQACCDLAGRDLLLVKSGDAYGVRVAYPNPAHLGADRFVGLLAARRLVPGQAALVIDAGTAVTVDGLYADGTHLGGLILPGLQLLGDVLISRTQAKHMDAALFDNPVVFANNTPQAMGSGCLFALVGALEGICQRMQQQMQEPAGIILCGGDAALLHAHVRFNALLHPDALMDGLHYLAEQAACTPC